MYFPLLLLAFVSVSLGKVLDSGIDDDEWRDYKLSFGKVYSEHEEAARYQVWKIHVKEIIEHNKHTKTFYKGINNFTDMAHEEFQSTMGRCFKLPKHMLEGNITTTGLGSTYLPPSNVKLPDQVDWRKEGYVTPVKNQGRCGSCYAFSTTGALEGQMFKKKGILPDISEQNIVDCSQKYGNNGCNGGLMDFAFQYIKDNEGIDSEEGYPYYGQELGHCFYNQKYSIAQDTGFFDVVPSGDEDALKAAIAANGPVSVAIDASHPSLQHYKSGVYNEPQCGSGMRSLDHGVLAVGYGTEVDGGDYWLIKNSWSNKWGDEGYIKIARNKNNMCGVATKASFPLV